MVLVKQLHFNKTLDLYMNSDQKTAKWRNVKLINWADGKAAESAYNTVLNATGISWAKVTHLQKAGMEQGSAQGELSNDEMATMSKHRMEKIF